ncbi:hypothetical protein KM043_010286 [Ampulex compressa]|nr:hypothetical protein KM043_010286 [Ampulex compressa]
MARRCKLLASNERVPLTEVPTSAASAPPSPSKRGSLRDVVTPFVLPGTPGAPCHCFPLKPGLTPPIRGTSFFGRLHQKRRLIISIFVRRGEVVEEKNPGDKKHDVYKMKLGENRSKIEGSRSYSPGPMCVNAHLATHAAEKSEEGELRWRGDFDRAQKSLLRGKCGAKNPRVADRHREGFAKGEERENGVGG